MQFDWFLPYAAGFFDGEGSVDIRWRVQKATTGKSYERFELRVHVVQIATEPLEAMMARWGGSIKLRKGSNCSDWVITDSAAGRFIRDVRPFLMVKAAEADVALTFADTIRPRLVNTAGSKGVDRISDDVREARRGCLDAIRAARAAKGVKPKKNAVSAPEARLANH